MFVETEESYLHTGYAVFVCFRSSSGETVSSVNLYQP